MLKLLVGLLAVSGTLAVITENRTLPSSFTGISVSGPFFVTVEKQTSGLSLTIVADVTEPKVVAAIETKVEGSILAIRFLPPYDHNTGRLGCINITVRADEVSNLAMTGSGSLTVSYHQNVPSVSVSISGSGVVSCPITCTDLTSQISGSGGITLITSRASNAVIRVSGSGTFNGSGLQTDNAAVALSGSGNILARVANRLSGTLTGSGWIHYGGSPSNTVEISGSGKTCSVDNGACPRLPHPPAPHCGSGSGASRNAFAWFAVVLSIFLVVF